MIKIFFGCSMRGGYGFLKREDLEKFPDLIESIGCKIMSKHQTQANFQESENKMTRTQIHDRDYEWTIQADMGVFEISNPSLGAGGEISDMVHLGKPVLCLFRKGLEEKVSAYTQGKMGSKYVKTPFECHSYEMPEDAEKIIRQFIKKHLPAKK